MNKLNMVARLGRLAGAAALSMLVLSGCGGGGGASPPPPVVNLSPVAAFTLSGLVQAGGTGIDAIASAGSELVLDAAPSKDPEGDTLAYKWSIVSKPAGSAMALSSDTAAKLTFRPDAAGALVLNVRVTDSKGAFADKSTTLQILQNAAPAIEVHITATFPGVSTTRPAQDVSVGSAIALDAAGSTDADGDTVTTAWTLVSKPDASAAALATQGMNTRFGADAAGTYKVLARATDSQGHWSETTYVFEAANRPPSVSNLLVKTSFTGASSSVPVEQLSVGATVLFDASNSTDAEGDYVSTTYSLLERPAASGTGVYWNGPQSAVLTLDVQGLYKVRVRGKDAQGAYSDVVYQFEAKNRVPRTILIASAMAPPGSGGKNAIEASTGESISLSSASIDPDSKYVYSAWQLLSKPAGSGTALDYDSGLATHLTPDVLGNYVVRLTVTDNAGASSSFETTIAVANQSPLAAITNSSDPVAQLSVPAMRLPVDTLLTLRGGASSDPDGGSLVYAWSIDSKPAASSAALATPSAANVQVKFDAEGSYLVTLRVTDAAGAFSQQSVTVEVGNHAPVVVLDDREVVVLQGAAAAATAAYSFDEENDPLTYTWAVTSRPVGSVAAIAAPHAAALAFTPDAAGAYTLSVTVSDGKSSSVGYLHIAAQ